MKPIIFLAFANERDGRSIYLRNLPAEVQLLRRACEEAEEKGLCELVIRVNASFSDIVDVFRKYHDRIAVFHFGGHADSYRLLFAGQKDELAAVDAEGFASFLAQQGGLQLVFLNASATAGQVAGLQTAGVPIVIATSQDVSDEVAAEFASKFYQSLAKGTNSVNRAFAEANAIIKATHDEGNLRVNALYQTTGDIAISQPPWQLYTPSRAKEYAEWSLQTAANDPLFGLPRLSMRNLPVTPYRHLEFFSREDAEIFFGRGHEIANLYRRVTDLDGDTIILFYGQSGVGKSSVLAAGLLPRLEQKQSVVYTRRDQARGLAGTLVAAINAPDLDELSTTWRAIEASSKEALTVILDQVEEIFTRPNPSLPNEMESFLTALEGIFANRSMRPKGRLILSFRKEWLAEIDRSLQERTLPYARVFLERLNRVGIVEAITGPARSARLRSYYGLEVETDLPDSVAHDLLADLGSPLAPVLQILLTSMWTAAKENSYDHPYFDRRLYDMLRVQGLGLDDFLTRQLASLHYRRAQVVESGLALDLLAFHTTPLGTAEQRTLAEVEQTYKHQADVLPGLIQEFRDLYLLVDPSADQLYQPLASRLLHNTLAPHVRKHFNESDAPGQRARRILENRVIDWKDGREGASLDEHDLRLVEAGLMGMRALTVDEERLLKASREALKNREPEPKRSRQEQVKAHQVEQLTLPAVWLYIADGNDQNQMNMLQQQDRVTWVANQNTRADDLILMYRSAPYSDIAYVFRAQTNPKRSSTLAIWRRNYTIELGDKLTLVRPVNLVELRNHPHLKEWSLPRTPQGAMQRKEDIRAEGYWEPLRSLLVAWNPAIAEPLTRWENLTSKKILADALSVAFEMPNDTAQVLAVLAPYLSGELLTQALKGTLTIKTEEMRAQALIALAPHLSSDLLQEGLIAARNIQGEAYRVQVLAAFALHLPKVMQRVQVLEEAIASVHAIENRGKRDEAMATLVGPLIECLQDEDSTVRRVATEVLGQTGDARVVEPLIKCLQDKDLVIHRTAALALARMTYDDRAVTAVLDFLGEERKTHDFIYDVFVSYSHADENWVQEWLLPRLKEKGLRVIEFRDFEIGVPLEVNIQRAIEFSRNVLIVLSPDWVRSEWTQLEDLLELPIRGQRGVVPLILKECKPPGLLGLLTFADFTDNNLLEQEWRRLIDSLERAAPNPFTSIQAIRDPEQFIGRVPLLERLNRQLQSGSVALIGERKIGKTSLLHRLADVLQSEENQVVVYWDFSNGGNMTALLAEVTDALGRGVNSWDEFQVVVRGRRIVLLLDEFDVARKYGFSREIFHRFRFLCGIEDGLRLVTASRRAPSEIFFEPDPASPPWNFMYHEEVGPLTHEEAQLLLNHPWSADAHQFDPSICDELIKLSNYHPFRLQRAAYHRYEAFSNSSYDWRALYERDMAIFQPDVGGVERLSPAASNATCWAEGLRQATGADRLYTEYMLAGLYQDAAGPLRLLLTMADDDTTIHSELNSLVNNMTSSDVRMADVHPVPETALRNVPLSPNSQKVLMEALRLADQATAYFISPQHLLAGLLAVPDAVATEWITNLLGVDREALYQLLAEAPDGQMPLNEIRQLLPPQVPTYQLHYQVQPQGGLAVGESLHLELVLQPGPPGNDAFRLPAHVHELHCFITTEGLSVLDTNVATMHRHPQTGAPMPVRFELRAEQVGQAWCQVQFYGEELDSGQARPLYTSQMPIMVYVAKAGEERLPVLPVLDLRAAPQPHILLQVKVDVQVSKVAGTQRIYVLSHYLTSRLPLGEPLLRGELVGRAEVVEADLVRMQTFFTDTLNQVGGQSEDVREQMISLGAYLFDRLFPKEKATAFRAALARIETYDKSRASGQHLTWLVVEEGLSEVWMPWEMLVPHALTDEVGEDEAWRFLGEQYYLSRWVTGLGTQLFGEVPWGELGLADHVFVTPDDAEGRSWRLLLRPRVSANSVTPLFNATASEGQDNRLLYGLHVLQRADQLVGQRSLVPLPSNQTKGTQTTPNTQEEAVTDIRASIRRQRPVVGLSILTDPGQQSNSNGLLPGIALSYLRAGASAVVGPWWPTVARADRIFWASFYHLLESRVPLGEAVWRARQEVYRAIPEQPDWLAYTLFGDPRAQSYLPPDSLGYAALECLDAVGYLRSGQNYTVRATVASYPPIWYKERLLNVEASPGPMQAVLTAPKLGLSSELLDLEPVGRTMRQATVPIAPAVPGNYVVISQFLKDDQLVKTLKLTLTVRDADMGATTDG